MSTIYTLPDVSQIDPEGDAAQDLYGTGKFQWVNDYTEKCDICDRELTSPAIMRHCMSGKTFWMHRNCAEEFGLELIKDAARTNYVHVNQVQNWVDGLRRNS